MTAFCFESFLIGEAQLLGSAMLLLVSAAAVESGLLTHVNRGAGKIWLAKSSLATLIRLGFANVFSLAEPQGVS